MTDLTFALILSFTVAAIFIVFVVLFILISNLKAEIHYLGQRVDSRAFESSVQRLSKTAYATKDKLDAVCAHYNLEIGQEPSRYVVRKK